MTMMTDDELLAEVEGFLLKHDMPHTRFGREAMADGSLVQHLRAGRSLTVKNANKVLGFMREYRPSTTEAAA